MLLGDLEHSELGHEGAILGKVVVDMLSVKVTDIRFEGLAKFVDCSISVGLVA